MKKSTNLPKEEFNSKVVSEKGASRKDALSDDPYRVENERQHSEGDWPEGNQNDADDYRGFLLNIRSKEPYRKIRRSFTSLHRKEEHEIQINVDQVSEDDELQFSNF